MNIYRFFSAICVSVFIPAFFLFLEAAEQPSFDKVKEAISSLTAKKDYAGCENFVREQLVRDWPAEKKDELYFNLGYSLYMQKNYRKSLNIFKQIEKNQTLRPLVFRYAAESAFNTAEYDAALEYMLQIYIGLKPEEKIGASKIVFHSFLYTEKLDKAAKWYSKLNDAKRDNINTELESYLKQHPAIKTEFYKMLQKAELAPGEKEEPVKQAATTAATTSAPVTAKNTTVTAATATTAAAKPIQLDASYTPDWSSICVMLADDAKWTKVNEVVTAYLEWYFKEYAKSGITPNFMNYSSHEDIQQGFAKARELKCFAVIGPLFTDLYADDFVKQSKAFSMPVFSFTSYFSNDMGIVFNFKHTKDAEFDETVKYLVGQEKLRYAIAYPDNISGRLMRDMYWEAVNRNGGSVTDALQFEPGEKAFLDLVDSLIKKPGLSVAQQKFKEENKDKFKTATIMKRNLEKVEKLIPGKADFDVLLIAGTPTQVAMLVPALSYKNIEFEYFTPYEKYRIKEEQKKLDELELNLYISTILLVPPSDVKGAEDFDRNIGKFIDGMIISSTASDISEANKPYTELNGKFKEQFQRDMFPIEQNLAEIAAIVIAGRDKSGKTNIPAFIDTLKKQKFQSIPSNCEISFNSIGQLTGNRTLFVGVKNRGFIPASEAYKKTKDKDKDKGTDKEKPADQ